MERRRRAEAERYRHLTNWHRVFAWWPVWVASDDCRWWEWVERKLTFSGAYDGGITYVDHRPSPPTQKDTI